jgi:hypothetical protein
MSIKTDRASVIHVVSLYSKAPYFSFNVVITFLGRNLTEIFKARLRSKSQDVTAIIAHVHLELRYITGFPQPGIGPQPNSYPF